MSEAGRLSDPSTWVDQHGDYLFRYALMRLRDRSLAEEVVQETLLAALQARDKFGGQSSEKTWFVGILKHKIIDHFRKQRREVALEDTDRLPAEREETFRAAGEWVGHWTEEAAPSEWGADPVKMLEKREFWQALEQALATLPPRLAQVFILREMDEMKSEEICKLLGITESNLWVMLHRSRMQLRRTLEVTYVKAQISTQSRKAATAQG